MPFDPDTYLAGKSAQPASGGFDPDAYLKDKSGVAPPSAPASKPAATPAPRGAFQTWIDSINVPFDAAKSAASSLVAAPIANVAGLAATGYEAATRGGKGDGEMPTRFRDAVRDRLTYKPDNPVLDSMMTVPRAVGQAASGVGAAFKDAAKGGAANDSPRGMTVNAGAEGISQGLGFLGLRGAQAVPKVARTLSGETAAAARSEAVGATRNAVKDAQGVYGREQAARMSEANVYEDTARRTQQVLDAAAQRTGTPTADVVGAQVRDAYSQVMDAAKATRSQAVEPLYAKAREAAAARERDGARIDVKPAIAEIDELYKAAENIPDLRAKLGKLREAVEGRAPTADVPAPVGHGKITSRMAPLRAEVPREGLTYEQLDAASRYIKDIAFSGEAEGYGALIRNTAKKLSVALDNQINKFVPEHAAATAKYRELSEPMETLATKIGGALHDTEGGLKGDSYAKVPAQDLPARIFGRKDRIEQLVDALAGGKSASGPARLAAQAKVDTWVENWILDAKRGKVGDAARVDAPGMRSALEGTPAAADRLNQMWTREGQQAARIPELQQGAQASRKAAEVAAASKQKIANYLAAGDAQMAAGNAKGALAEYQSALRQSIAVADPDRYRAAIALIERADTLERKVTIAKRIAAGLAVATAGTIGGATLMKHGLALPGAL